MKKEINIVAPEGFEIDKEHSTFECIKFKPIEQKRWRDNEDAILSGYYIDNHSIISVYRGSNMPSNYNVFATEKQAKSAIAMARISQIMANDKRFGGVVTDEEWENHKIVKYVIKREENHITTNCYYYFYHLLAFHTPEQRNLFLKENEDLVKDYLMFD